MNKRIVLIKKITLFALLLALCWLLPLVTGQIPEIGSMLCPMHIPVIIAGFIMGPLYGCLLGFIAPLTRTLIFTMPILYPTSICMAFELATYGLISGLLYTLLSKKGVISIFISLIVAMLAGRFIWGIAMFLCGLINQNAFTFKAFMTGAFFKAWPGIIIQLILIPLIIIALRKAKLINKD